ncbi:30S ribosomal protein S17 [Candidatus Falkowbacteria bacterium]|nr:30S ribosomal protein S17 [Candidatus Falkowbacteria bacterium]
MSEEKKNKRKFQGVVVSHRMDKTAVVSVSQVKVHPKYGKRYKTNERYKVHDEKNECKIGELVMFEECRPISKEKRWRIVK